ncbi:class IV adenylate cyclase [Granulicella cerasi]|uniref:Class IV adenylate cyclase n=1 Tax=Granulicella cerasi TaxID=741063 RepID=A0ABW1Z4S0_9BACT|nr:class IV adenylate cyclase [Granulicella cerasi]
MAAEIELKFPVAEMESLIRRAESTGFQLVTPRTFESNTLYDTADRQLRQRTELVRIRQYGERWTLTHKRLPEHNDPTARFKTRVETETTVSDGEALAEVFTRMGYGPVFRYEKFRTEWDLEGGHLVLDETPIGVWAELEGQPEWIDAMLEKLGVDPATSSTASYGALFLEWKKQSGSAAENLTFDEAGVVAAG